MFQPVDYKKVFSDAKDFLECCINNLSNTSNAANRDWKQILKAEIKRLKIINWYNVVCHLSGSSSAYSLQSKYDSESFIRRNGETFHSNKWRSYRDGKHFPNAKLIERVESMTPGSAFELEHTLWDAIDVRIPIGNRANPMFKTMSSEIQNAIFVEPFKKYETIVRRSSNQRISDLICKNCDLDSLAALTILTREAHEGNRKRDAHFWACKTFRHLLMLGLELHHRGIACSIIGIYRHLIFEDITEDGFCFIDSETDIARSSAHLAIMAFEIDKREDVALTWEVRVQRMKKLLSGANGFDVFFAMQPQWAPEHQVENHLLKNFEKMQRLRKWGWDSISGKIPFSRVPPDEVITGIVDDRKEA